MVDKEPPTEWPLSEAILRQDSSTNESSIEFALIQPKGWQKVLPVCLHCGTLWDMFELRGFIPRTAGRPLKQATLSIRMVAGFAEVIEREDFVVTAACNHPNCLVIPFSAELIRLAA
jgi:hypothetical protein